MFRLVGSIDLTLSWEKRVEVLKEADGHLGERVLIPIPGINQPEDLGVFSDFLQYRLDISDRFDFQNDFLNKREIVRRIQACHFHHIMEPDRFNEIVKELAGGKEMGQKNLRQEERQTGTKGAHGRLGVRSSSYHIMGKRSFLPEACSDQHHYHCLVAHLAEHHGVLKLCKFQKYVNWL